MGRDFREEAPGFMKMPSGTAPGLLVSVRSAAEALSALAGGAAIIDVKEPANGPLGRAADPVIVTVVSVIGGRCPVSAALGELRDDVGAAIPDGLSFVKWGLAGQARSADWRCAIERRARSGARVVHVAYADWPCAGAPPVEEVFAAATARAGGVLLVDTHCKEAATRGRARPTLLDWLPIPWLEDLCGGARAAGVRVALAGSLGAREIRALAGARPDWFAVRGAACEGGREGVVSTEQVRALAQLIRQRHDHAG
jgi:uncharacterized protein (UPF0264 family)